MPSAENKRKALQRLTKRGRDAHVGTSKTGDVAVTWTAPRHQSELRLVSNVLLEHYYGELQRLGCLVAPTGVSASEAWRAELELFRRPLPITLWINDTDEQAPVVRRYMESLSRTMVEPIAWYPLPGMAWRVLADKTTFRQRPELQELRQFLIRQTAMGTISRQEEVSMIPPLLLQIRPHDTCLDLCASPGSKTAQMLVALGRHKSVPFDSPTSPFPFDYASEGLVMANELDTKRANMLVHQVKRLRLLFPFALFTNHDARFFPEIYLDGDESVNRQAMRFDKILCDVVCSGDGTLRKAPHLFQSWSPHGAINLQKTQIQIALRACHLLKVGGRLVYSTCSLNPIENEAVVTQLVHRTGGAMRLVDARPILPELPCAPGLTSWVVMDVEGHVVTQPGPCPVCAADKEISSKQSLMVLHEALFPPHTVGAYDSAAVDALDLRLCVRLLPSHCNGGGFFIAVLDKVAEFRLTRHAAPADEDGRPVPTCGDADIEDTSTTRAGRDKGDVCRTHNADRQASTSPSTEQVSQLTPSTLSAETQKVRKVPPQYVQAPDTIRRVLYDFYEVDEFPVQQLFVRTAHGERSLRLTASSTCTLVSRTAQRVLEHKSDALIVVSAGLRVLAYETLDKGWRISSEAALLFAKLMRHSSRFLHLPVALVQRMIEHGGKMKELPFDAIEDTALRERVLDLPLGVCLIAIDAPAAVGGTHYSVVLRARTRLQLFVDHEDLVGMQLRLGLEPASSAPATLQVGDETA